MSSALVLGGVSFDTIIYLDALPAPVPRTLWSRGFHETIGSTGAGKALNLAKLGLDVTLHALIGDDAYGQRIREYLRDNNITFLHDLDPLGTARHVNLLNGDGARISIFLTAGTFAPQVATERLDAAIAAHDHIVLNIINYCRELIPRIQQQHKAIWCDIHDYDGANTYHDDFIRAADYLTLSSDALPDYRPFMRRMIDAGKQLVICTHGKHGSTALTAAGEWIEQPSIPGYAFKDSNGAGDAFFAGVLFGHTRGYPLRQCLRLGALMGGLCITSEELALSALSRTLLAAEYQRVYGEPLR
jgi:sugar/nucleoside kinase (ribokinase family)